MDFSNINTYFPIDFKCMGKCGTGVHIYPETEFTKEQYDEVLNENEKIRGDEKKYRPLSLNTCLHPAIISIYAEYQYVEKQYHKEIIESIIKALNHVKGIRKVIINDWSIPFIEDENPKQRNPKEYGLDQQLGIEQLTLNYPVHVQGLDGENFNFSVYFTDDKANEQKADAISNAVKAYDFKLTGDDYSGYMSFTIENDKVSIYLDLGNVEPQNGDKVIHGMLLALNSIEDIENVIINEEI